MSGLSRVGSADRNQKCFQMKWKAFLQHGIVILFFFLYNATARKQNEIKYFHVEIMEVFLFQNVIRIELI